MTTRQTNTTICDSCGFTVEMPGTQVPDTWYRLKLDISAPHKTEHLRYAHLCPDCSPAWLKVIGNKDRLPQLGDPL